MTIAFSRRLLSSSQRSRSRPGAVGQAHVGDDGAVGAVLADAAAPPATRAGGVDVVALAQQRQLVERAQVGLVVDDEQAEVRGSGHRGERAIAVRQSARRRRRGACRRRIRCGAARRRGAQPVVDAGAVALAELAANVQAEPAAAAAGREERLEQIGARRRPRSARRRSATLKTARAASSADAASRTRIAPGAVARRGGARCRAG